MIFLESENYPLWPKIKNQMLKFFKHINTHIFTNATFKTKTYFKLYLISQISQIWW